MSIDKGTSNQSCEGLEMRLIGVSLAILLAFALTAATSSGSDGFKDAPSAKARAIGIAFARCAVREDRQAVMDFLFEPFGTNDPAKLGKAMPSACLDVATGHAMSGPSHLRTSALLMRGLLFEALYAHDFRKLSAPLAFERVPPRNYDVAGTDEAGQSMRRDYRALMKIGDCTARKSPEKVRALLNSAAASAEENGAIADLHDDWIGCLPGHRELPFSIEMMRATLSEPFYRLVRASGQSEG